MRIGFVTTHLPPDDHFGGVVWCGYHLSRYLKKHTQQCLTACVSRDPSAVLANGADVDTCTRSWWLHRWGCSPSFAIKIRGILRSVDLLHVYGVTTWPVTMAAVLARIMGVPYMVTAHGGYAAEWRYSTPHHKLFLKILGKRILRNASCLHATAPLEVAGFRALGYEGAVTVIPNGIEPSDFADLPQPEYAEQLWPALRGCPVVLFLSRISPEKGLDQLVAGIVRWRSSSGIPEGKPRLLDIGCGYGYFSREARNRGFEVTAVNPSEWERSICFQLAGIEPIPGFFEEIDFTNHEYDAIIASQVLEHIVNPMPFLEKTRDLLAPGGVLALAVPSFDSVWVRLLRTRENGVLWVPEHVNYFTPHSLELLLRRAGFRTIQSRQYLRVPYNCLSRRFGLRGAARMLLNNAVRFGQIPFALAVCLLRMGACLHVWCTCDEATHR